MQLKEGHKTTSKQGVSKIIKEETKEPKHHLIVAGFLNLSPIRDALEIK